MCIDETDILVYKQKCTVFKILKVFMLIRFVENRLLNLKKKKKIKMGSYSFLRFSENMNFNIKFFVSIMLETLEQNI